MPGRTLFSLFFTLFVSIQLTAQTPDYASYHRSVLEAERLLVQQKFDQALSVYTKLFEEFDFVFLHEYQVAAQLAVYVDQKDVAYEVLEEGIKNGWTKKSVRKHSILHRLKGEPRWEDLMKNAKAWNTMHSERLDNQQKEVVHDMFRKDQWKALGALFKLSSDAQDRYAERRFAPQSEMHVQQLRHMLINSGYPGEKRIGNELWMSTILSHHNSISKEYNSEDSLFTNLYPMLVEAWHKGEIAPFSLALMNEWCLIVTKGSVGYGILNDVPASEVAEVNARRELVGLRSIDLRNQLVELSEKTQIDFHLPGAGWTEGEIKIIPD